MTNPNERIGACEGCNTPLFDGDTGHRCCGGEILCEKCSPSVGDVLSQYLDYRRDGDVPEGFDSADELEEAISKLKADDPSRPLLHAL